MYSNLIGCDGERVYYDGCCLIAVNGEIVAQGSQFTLDEVEVTVATVDLDDVRSFRGARLSRGMQTGAATPYPRVHANCPITQPPSLSRPLSQPVSVSYLMPEEEIRYCSLITAAHRHTPPLHSLGPACWLWDYLRRSSLSGFFLPLSGGLDSSSVACLVSAPYLPPPPSLSLSLSLSLSTFCNGVYWQVGCMCRLVVEAVARGCVNVANDLRRLLGRKTEDELPKSAQDLAK